MALPSGLAMMTNSSVHGLVGRPVRRPRSSRCLLSGAIFMAPWGNLREFLGWGGLGMPVRATVYSTIKSVIKGCVIKDELMILDHVSAWRTTSLTVSAPETGRAMIEPFQRWAGGLKLDP